MTSSCCVPCNYSPAVGCVERFAVRDYDLGATLSSGQAFRWREQEGSWVGVIGRHWVRLRLSGSALLAHTAEPVTDWAWLIHYLQMEVNLEAVLRTFPDDPPLRAALQFCRGLRVLRQDPWECLASFILSSTKQILQIQQIIAELCRRYGTPVAAPPGHPPVFAFPTAERLAAVSEADLRACKMGFRAPFLLAAARGITDGRVNLNELTKLPLAEARTELVKLEGVGRKIADCVLLFAFGHQEAFPVDVWIMKALRHFYFPRRKMTPPKLQEFAESHFGPYAGYAQQYLFHYARLEMKRGAITKL